MPVTVNIGPKTRDVDPTRPRLVEAVVTSTVLEPEQPSTRQAGSAASLRRLYRIAEDEAAMALVMREHGARMIEAHKRRDHKNQPIPLSQQDFKEIRTEFEDRVYELTLRILRETKPNETHRKLKIQSKDFTELYWRFYPRLVLENPSMFGRYTTHTASELPTPGASEPRQECSGESDKIHSIAAQTELDVAPLSALGITRALCEKEVRAAGTAEANVTLATDVAMACSRMLSLAVAHVTRQKDIELTNRQLKIDQLERDLARWRNPEPFKQYK